MQVQRSVSFRVWLGAGIVVIVLPLFASAVLHALAIRSAARDFRNVVERDRAQLIPLQQLRADLLAADSSLQTLPSGGDGAQPWTSREVRGEIDTGFARLAEALFDQSDPRAMVERARTEWTAADRIASQLSVAPSRQIHNPEPGNQARASIAAAVDQLNVVERVLTGDIDREYVGARRAAERARWIGGIAALCSVVSLIGAIAIIRFALSKGLDPLVEGAARFAAGDHDHRIEVVPLDLRRVADAFTQLASQLHDSRAALADIARHDCLTGLLNRRALDETLADALARHERANEGVAVVVIDVDLFKVINDTYGHFAGDEVLRLVSARVTRSIREVDRAFRFGGEEFAVLLFNADRASAEAAAERVRIAVAESPMTVNGTDIGVTISAGIATTDDSGNAEGLLNAADAALYCAKSTGRNRVVWVGAMA